MRKILVVGFVLLLAVVVVFRQRIYVRDPLAKAQRNGVHVEGAGIFINYSNDVLMEEPSAGRRYLVQGWSSLPGTPKHLFCFTGLMCWTDADKADVFALEGVGGRTKAVMSAKNVSFVDDSGAKVSVDLR